MLPVGVPGWLRYDRNAFPEFLDRSRWLPPPYRDVYRDNRFRFARPMCVVCNKATSEYYKWHRSMTNHLPRSNGWNNISFTRSSAGLTGSATLISRGRVVMG